jgi:hypothetical protein
MRICMLPLSIAALLAPTLVSAAGQFDPAARAKVVAPFVDDQTVLVARVDVARLDTDALVDKGIELVRDLIPEAQPDLERFRKREEAQARAGMKEMQAAFRKAGGRDVYVLFSLADVDFRRDPVPFLIVPLGEGADEKMLATLFRQIDLDESQRLANALFVGPKATLERLKTLNPSPRPEIADAFRGAGDSAAQALLLPPKYAARVIEEMLPRLPKEIGGGPSTAITHGLLWAALAVDAPPEISFRLTIQSRSAEAAAAFREKWIAGLLFMSEQEEVRERVPTFKKLAALLTPGVEGDRLTLTFDQENRGIENLISLLKPSVASARTAARRAATTNNFKQIALAMHNYHDTHKSFPAVASYDDGGKPLLSWRVHILPYLGHEKLYRQFRLDEPWDSEHNRKLIDQMPRVYSSPASKLRGKGRSSCVLVVGQQTVFPGREAIPIKEIKDGTSNTILAVEVADEHAVVWTKPQDLPFDPENPRKGLGGLFPDGFIAAFCDGSVHFLANDIDPEVLCALLTRAGGDVVPRGSF